MEAEMMRIKPALAALVDDAKAAGSRVIAVGTTSVRSLETAADPERPGRVRAMEAPTQLFIRPGFRFSVCDALLTNFHLPRSTLFMLASAFSGLDSMRGAYEHAIHSGYRFYSYGDACLLFPERAG